MFKRLVSSILLATVLTTYATADTSPEELTKRQCSSVHLRHAPIQRNSQAIYLQAEALQSAPGTYFCAANMDNCYIGFQEISPDRKVLIFSIWDPIPHGDNPNDVPENEKVQCIGQHQNAEISRFGGEGTGGKSFLAYPWKIGEKMQFLIVNKPLGDNLKEIYGYFFNNHTKKWELISAWKTHSKEGELSYAVSFVEDFRRNYDSTKHIRSAKYGPNFSWTKDKGWVPATTGTFTKDPTPSEHIAAQVIPAEQRFLIQTGGDTKLGKFKVWEKRELPADSIKMTAPSKEVQDIVEKTLKK